MPAPMSSNLHVAVVGAGIVGLLVAQGLKENGIEVSIFEAEPSSSYVRAREWGMSVQWGLPLLDKVLPSHLRARLQETSVDPNYVFPKAGNSMRVYNGQTGEIVKDVPLVEMIRVSRRKMRALSAEGLPIQYGKKVVSVSKSTDGQTTITFEDGGSVSADLVIGADGANSRVRSCIFNDNLGESVQIPYGGVNMHVCYHDAETALFLRKHAHPIMCIGVHPKGYWLWLSIQEVPDPNKPEDWVFQLQWTWNTRADTAELARLDLEKLKEHAERDFGEPWKTAWLKIPAGTHVPGNRISVWAPKQIPEAYEGHVVLAGDAAHAMSFHRGQGLNHGINDAVTLTEVSTAVKEGNKTLTEATAEYQAEMIKRAGEEVKISRMNTDMMHDWEQVRQSPFLSRGGDKNK